MNGECVCQHDNTLSSNKIKCLKCGENSFLNAAEKCQCDDGFLMLPDGVDCVRCHGPGATVSEGECECRDANSVMEEGECICQDGFLMHDGQCIPCEGGSLDQDGRCQCSKVK